MSEKGRISINAENIMPIIKKWLYSDKDIFIRELVSNASDAIVKHSRLVTFGQAPAIDGEYQITVTVNSEKKTLTFIDNGIGMTAEEVDKYINQVAFSGAEEFLKKYKEEEQNNNIIGHFGLGFYSAFMVAKKVTIDTLSWQEGATAVKWVSEDGMEFELLEGEQTSRGTTITLELNDDSFEFAEKEMVRTVLDKYCGFISTPLMLAVTGEDSPAEQINEIKPLWMKKPNECTDEEYKEFYQKVFHDYNEPLFWVHLNADYPFDLKGILYFPHYREGMGSVEGQVKMFCGQVFVADNIKEVIPEFLLLLKGVIDCPGLPLNVSRSFLQNDETVKKLSAYITRKVADKLIGIFENDREKFEGYWKDINPFVKYGCMKDAKFFDKVKRTLLFKTSDEKMVTFDELKEATADKDGQVYYATDSKRQLSAIKLFTDKGNSVVVFDSIIDINFISFLEYSDTGLKFKRIDADTDAIKSQESNEIDIDKIAELFKKAVGNDELKVTAESFDDKSMHALIVYDEQMRRFIEMSKFYGEGMKLPEDKTLVVNSASPLIKWLEKCGPDEKAELVCKQIIDLAEITLQPLENERMAEFIERSSKLLDYICS